MNRIIRNIRRCSLIAVVQLLVLGLEHGEEGEVGGDAVGGKEEDAVGKAEPVGREK